ncbi:MAG: A/G-specific adenine glycosylase [Candidatus Didemnitutus sp.]|nr:A/G-specific adenine glycosylase [Candidatus Didemnitutus sp.]
MATAPASLIARRADFHRALHRWYRTHQRALPWRTAPSLYSTVVSEFMLQQTQVVTMLPYFHRWLAELPDFGALAAASESHVVKLWEGLGYYARARNLHKLAQAFVARPAEPRTPQEWRELPGIGPYTAAAVTSIAFGHPAACVDGNVVRILARLTGDARVFGDGSAAAKHFTPLADALIIESEPGLHNQAMMELGATVCARTKPLCLTCPVAEFCVARHRGDPEALPKLAPKKIEQRAVARVWCEHAGKLLLRRGAAGARRLAGLHELPEPTDVGRDVQAEDLLATERRTITRYQITERIYRVQTNAALRRRVEQSAALVWVDATELASLTLSGPHRRWIRQLQTGATPPPKSRRP